MITHAIKEQARLKIVYLKSSDEKSERIICPQEVGEMSYQEKSFIGLSAYCLKRSDARIFRVDRILEMERVDKKSL